MEEASPWDGDGEECGLTVGRALDLARTEARICGEAAPKLCQSCLDAGRRGVRDHDLDRISRGPREVAFQRDEALLRGEAVRQRGDAARPHVHSEHWQREQEQRACGQHQADDRAPQHAADDRAPEAAFGIRGLERAPPDQRYAERVHLVSEEPEDGRQQRERGDDGGDPDENRSHCQAAHDRVRDEQHSEHGDDEDAAAEEDGPARGGAGGLDRRELAPPLASLLSVTGNDEERVVDPQRETHAGEHVDDEHRELELLREQRGQAERDDDRHDRHQERYEPGDDRAEDEEQDDERGGQSELELAVLQVLLRKEVEVVVERLRARDRHGERSFFGDRFDLLDERLGLTVVGEGDRNDRRMSILRDERLAAVEVRSRTPESCDLALSDEIPDVALEPGRVDRDVLRTDDDDVGHRRRRIRGKRREPSIFGALRLWVVRRRALGREAATQEHGDHGDREDRDDRPRTEHPPRMARAGGGERPCPHLRTRGLIVGTYISSSRSRVIHSTVALRWGDAHRPQGPSCAHPTGGGQPLRSARRRASRRRGRTRRRSRRHGRGHRACRRCCRRGS